MTVELRGIYTTALTALLNDTAVGPVVNASDPIKRRFEDSFEVAPPEATIIQTPDRLGVGIHGRTEAVEAVVEALRSLGVDTFVVTESAPQEYVCTGVVDRTVGSGAILTLPDGREGYLPYAETDTYVDVGDHYCVQVVDPRPPWGDAAPGVSTTPRVSESLVELERGHDGPTATVDTEATTALLRSMEFLDVTVPEHWGVRWNSTAVDASVDTREQALRQAIERAQTIESALTEPSTPPQTLATPTQTRWIRFGRASRGELDHRRQTVTQTLDGHHRIKAVGDEAGTAVDFTETVCESPSVTDTALVGHFGPAVGDTVTLQHGKPHGGGFSLGSGTVTERDGATITIEREITSDGTYDALGTERAPGDRAVTRCVEGQWWYPTVYRGADGANKGTYVNIATPLELFPKQVHYVDLYIDVIQPPGEPPTIVDEEELTAAVDAGELTDQLARKARTVARSVKRALS